MFLFYCILYRTIVRCCRNKNIIYVLDIRLVIKSKTLSRVMAAVLMQLETTKISRYIIKVIDYIYVAFKTRIFHVM